MKITKHSLDHIELVSSGDTALFEIMNLLHLAAQGEDIETGAQEFLKSMMTLDEQRVYLAKVEKVSYNIDEIGDK